MTLPQSRTLTLTTPRVLRVLIVASRRFNSTELFGTISTLKTSGIKFDIASVSKDMLIFDEKTYKPARVNLWIDSVDPRTAPSRYDGLVFVSGNMKDTESHWDNSRVLHLVDAFNQKSKPIAAICCSVPSIRGAAYQKKVSFYPLVRARVLLEKAGAILENVAVTADQNLVTAEHEVATKEWMEAFVYLLKTGKPPVINLRDSGFQPGKDKGFPYKKIPELEAIKERGGND